MPEIDPTSPYAHLIQLALEYQEIIELMESGALDIEELARLNITVTDREQAPPEGARYRSTVPQLERNRLCLNRSIATNKIRCSSEH